MTDEEVRVAEADYTAAEKKEKEALSFLKGMKPEQKEIQKRKKKFEKMQADPGTSPEDVRTERAKLNNAIADYNRRRQGAEKKYYDAKENASKLKEELERLKSSIASSTPSEPLGTVSERSELSEKIPSTSTNSQCQPVTSTPAVTPMDDDLQKALEDLKLAQEEVRKKRDEYLKAQREEEDKKNKLLELLLKSQASCELALVAKMLLTKTSE